MLFVLVVFAIASVAAAATLAINLRNRAAGRTTLPTPLVWLNLGATTVTLILAVLAVAGVGA